MLDKRLTWMSGSAKAGTTAERHTCELRVLTASLARAPPKRASGESFSPLTKDLHGCRQPGSYPAFKFKVEQNRYLGCFPLSIEEPCHRRSLHSLWAVH